MTWSNEAGGNESNIGVMVGAIPTSSTVTITHDQLVEATGGWAVSRHLDDSIGPDILTRWFIDARPLADAVRPASTPELPLLETLRTSDQKAVLAYHHSCDRQMSLASQLLKYLFVHKACRIPWDQIEISRTPPPHKRPYYDPSTAWTTARPSPTARVEFNVSHQGYITALAGCQVPMPATQSRLMDGQSSPTGTSSADMPQVGVDITCIDDPTRRRAGTVTADKDRQAKTEEELLSFINMFSEVFSEREMLDMGTRDASNYAQALPSRNSPSNTTSAVAYRLRLFYTYWALKEAYIKMTGEALLAPWLRDLEFVDVEVPEPATNIVAAGAPAPQSAFGPVERRARARLSGRDVENARLETVGFEKDYIFATCARNGGFGASTVSGAGDSAGAEKADERLAPKLWDSFRSVDIWKDVAPCARGVCCCLE
ncbi:hypothetical protein KEM52_000062 [Ascosphaera acerosa]|nr:hypothetical protein KEM52_000062 [Ascosphaera acerosa]